MIKRQRRAKRKPHGVPSRHCRFGLLFGIAFVNILCIQPQQRAFIRSEMDRFCQKFTNRRTASHCPKRTEFILNKLSHSPAYYLWTRSNEQKHGTEVT